MSILILEEIIKPSAVGVDPMEVPHHKVLMNALKSLSAVYTLKDADFEFKYLIDDPLVVDDSKTLSKKKLIDNFSKEYFNTLIGKYDIVILLGSKISQEVFGQSIKKIEGKAQFIGDTVVIPSYSAFELSKKSKSVNSIFSHAYQRYIGEYLHRDLPRFEIVKDLKRVKEIISFAKITGLFSFDFETCNYLTGDHLAFYEDTTVATVVSLCFQPGMSYIIPIEHKDYVWAEPQFKKLINLLSDLFEDPDTTKIAHNLSYDRHWLFRYGIKLRGRLADTMLMHHILDEHSSHKLKEITSVIFPFWEGYGDSVDFAGDLEPLSKYAGIDTDITLRLFYIFEHKLLEEPELYTLFRNLTMFALPAIADLQYKGCRLDRGLIVKSIDKAEQLLLKKSKELSSYPEVLDFVKQVDLDKKQELLDTLESKITSRQEKGFDEGDRYIIRYREQIRDLKTNKDVYYSEVNFASPKQLASLLYDDYGFNFKVPIVQGVPKRTTQRDYIQDIDHPFINTLSAYRTISKMLSTYYRGILDRMDKNDYVHGSFLQHGTVTGRLSSRNPSLQNIPARLGFDDEDAKWCLKQVKRFFIPKTDQHYVLQADYSQAELRVIANVSKDPVMIDNYLQDGDIHEKTGAIIRGVSLEEFKKLPPDEYKKFRYYAKPANFGWVYKSSIEGYRELAKNTYGLDLSISEAEQHKNAIFKTYRNISRWHKLTESKVYRTGYVQTMFGRRRRLLNLHSNIKTLVNKDIRDAINTPIQGSAGELTIFCIGLLRHRLPKEIEMWCTVHDSIFFYIPKNMFTEYYIDIINDTCQNAPIFKFFDLDPKDYPVTMKMEYELSDESWGAMKEVGDFNKLGDLLLESDPFPNSFEEIMPY